jgi:hypothetical protein
MLLTVAFPPLAVFRFLSLVSTPSMSTLMPSLLWDDVYNRLIPYGVTVIGGRYPGVGVGGLILGGGE